MGTNRSQFVGALNPTQQWAATGSSSGNGTGLVIGPDGTSYVTWITTYTGVVPPNLDYLFAVRSDGTVKWTFPGESVGGAAVAPDGTIYVGVHLADCPTPAAVVALNADGTEKWQFSLGPCLNVASSAPSPVIASDGTIYVGATDGLWALTPSGSLKWHYQTSGYNIGGPVIGPSGVIYFGHDDGNVYALKPDGSLRWTYGGAQSPFPAPAFVEPDGTVYVLTGNFHVDELNSDGTLKTRCPTSDEVYAAALGADGTVYAEMGGSYAAIRADCSVAWSYAIYPQANSPPSIGADGTIYFTLTQDGLVALGPDGLVKWKAAVQPYTVLLKPVVGADGTIYIAGDQSVLLMAYH